MERTCENCEYKYEWVDCIQCCDCSCHNRWKPNSELSNFAIEELEKIKEDIENIRDWVGGTKRYFSEDELNEIFNKHISKLKGERE